MKFETQSPGDEAYGELNERLLQFNTEHAPWQRETFTIVAKDDGGRTGGGVRGVVNMGLIEIRGLWVDEDLRGTGLGRQLMDRLEQEARDRGAGRAALDTYDWQARKFYEQLGYVLFGTLPYPDGANRFYMVKEL